MTTSQVQAVVNAVTEVLGDSFTPGTTVVSTTLTNEQKKQVRELVKTAITNGEVAYNGSTTETGKFNRYVNGMINNHLMKSKKLNGGVPYQPKKKGTPRDAQLKELNKLQKTLTPGTSEYTQVTESIQNRRSQLSSTAGIDTTIVPQEVADMVERNNTDTSS